MVRLSGPDSDSGGSKVCRFCLDPYSVGSKVCGSGLVLDPAGSEHSGSSAPLVCLKKLPKFESCVYFNAALYSQSSSAVAATHH